MTLDPATIAAKEPGREAIVIGDQRWSYADLDNFSLAGAKLLRSIGLIDGDTVALLIGNCPDFLGVCWAAQRSGLYYLPISTKLTTGEIRYILANSGAKALFVGEGFEQLAQEAAGDAADFAVLELSGEAGDALRNGATEALPTPPAIEGGDMLYTSGTTGQPKGVRRPLRFEPLGQDTNRVARGERLFGFSSETRFLSPAPLYHAAPLRFSMNLLRTGACVIGMERFDPTRALELIETEAVTHSQWVPTMFTRLLALPEHVRNVYDLAAQQVAIHAGAPCAPSVKHAMIDWWGPVLHEYYSGTESVGFTHITSQQWLDHPGSVGRPYGCTVHILDDDGQELPAGATGAVYFSGKGGLEYHGDPEKTRAAHDGAGRSTMGDVGHLDEDGFLYLTDRQHFTIITGGVNVYPTEVEAALIGLPSVADCAVFGLPDPDLGEVVAAMVELDRAVDPHDSELAQRLANALKHSLAGPKQPRLWRFDTVGRSETGKIAKARLREACLSPNHMIDLRNHKTTQDTNIRRRECHD